MAKIREDLPEEGLTPEAILRRVAERLNPAGVDGVKNRAWQWKFDLDSGKKTKFDLYDELSKAPPKYVYRAGPQQLAAHKSETRIKQVAGGWRAGKSKWLAAEILPFLFKDNAQVWIVANNYVLARYEFDYILDWLRWLNAPLLQVSTPLTGRYSLRLEWGAILETQTADDATNIEGGNLDCAAVAEAGLMANDIVRRLSGRVAEKRGPILLSGSLDSSNPWYMDTFENYLNGPVDGVSWHSFGIPSWDNVIAFPAGEEDEEIQQWRSTLSGDEFKLKVAAQVAKPTELVFPEFDKGIHVVDFIFTNKDSKGFKLEYPEIVMDELGARVKAWRMPERGPVHLAIDPGYNGAYAVLAIRKYDDQVFLIDEVYARRWMVEDVISECKTRWWWSQVDYAVMDIAGKQHDAMASHLDIWKKDEHLGFKPATNFVPIPDGIQHLKTFLKNPLNGKPRIWVGKECRGLIDEFGAYRYRRNQEDRTEREEPIDRDNHSIKALAYYLFDRYSPARASRVTSEKYIKSFDTDSYLRRRDPMGWLSDWMGW